jgi:hypothetical protein
MVWTCVSVRGLVNTNKLWGSIKYWKILEYPVLPCKWLTWCFPVVRFCYIASTVFFLKEASCHVLPVALWLGLSCMWSSWAKHWVARRAAVLACGLMMKEEHSSCSQLMISLSPSLSCYSFWCCGMQIIAEIWNLSFTNFIKLLAIPGHAWLWLSLVKWKRKKRESARS